MGGCFVDIDEVINRTVEIAKLKGEHEAVMRQFAEQLEMVGKHNIDDARPTKENVQRMRSHIMLLRSMSTTHLRLGSILRQVAEKYEPLLSHMDEIVKDL